MDLLCDLTLAVGYKSPAQIARVVSEAWLTCNGYCLQCEGDSLRKAPPNTIFTDFHCARCGSSYELKTYRRRPLRSLVNGAYAPLISRIMNGSAPTLFLLQRSSAWTVESLVAIHSVFLTPSVIERRKPLSLAAVRAGWIGCNIRLDRIGPDGEIGIIENGEPRPREKVRARFRQFADLAKIGPLERGWTTLTLSIVRALAVDHFSLSDVYEHEAEFQTCYPNNRNVRAKIRQQLQALRDLNLITFEGRGRYRMRQ
jgi:type II restriction enzyme